MGSPISVVLAEMMMQKIEEEIQRHAPCTPKLWRRYVDDIICILPKEQVEQYLAHINSINSNIQFTVEKEQNNALPFLDLQIIRKNDGSLTFTVYRKPTHTENYLKFDSSNPINHKKAVIRSLIDRSLKICSNEELL